MTQEQFIVYIAAPLLGYLFGSIPFGLLIGKLNGIDIRTTGSKNIGATNLGRTLGKKFFWYAFLLDAAKGFVPVLLVAIFVHLWNTPVISENGGTFYPPYYTRPQLPSWSPLLTAIACVLGHMFPIYLKFKGGKGVSTSFGVILGVWPLYTIAGLAGGLVFVITLLIFRFISLASIVSVLSFVLFVTILGTQPHWFTYTSGDHLWPLFSVAALFAILIIFRHRANIARLLKGTEPKIGSKPPT